MSDTEKQLPEGATYGDQRVQNDNANSASGEKKLPQGASYGQPRVQAASTIVAGDKKLPQGATYGQPSTSASTAQQKEALPVSTMDTVKGVGSHIYHSFADAPTEEEKAKDSSIYSGGYTPNRIKRGIQRLTGYDENSDENFKQGIRTGAGNLITSGVEAGKDIASYATSPKPLLISDDKNGESLLHKYITGPAEAEYNKTLTAPTGMEAFGHSVAAALPLIGPIAAHLGEKAGAGDVAGAAGEGLTYLTAPKAVEKIVPPVIKGAVRPWIKTGAEVLRDISPKIPEVKPEVGPRNPAWAQPKPSEGSSFRVVDGRRVPITPAEAATSYTGAERRAVIPESYTGMERRGNGPFKVVGGQLVEDTAQPTVDTTGKGLSKSGSSPTAKVGDVVQDNVGSFPPSKVTSLFKHTDGKTYANIEGQKGSIPVDQLIAAKLEPLIPEKPSATRPASDELIPEAKPVAGSEQRNERGNVPDDLHNNLKSKGYSDVQISRMTPEEAQAHSEATTRQRTEVKATRADKAVETKAAELGDPNLKTVAKSVGINPDEYDFSARDANRHRTERDQLAKDVTAQLHPEETMRHADNAERMDKEGLWQSKDTSDKGKAARAAELFKHRLGNQPLDPYGNPKVAGGAPDEWSDDLIHVESPEPKPQFGPRNINSQRIDQGPPEGLTPVGLDSTAFTNRIQQLGHGKGVEGIAEATRSSAPLIADATKSASEYLNKILKNGAELPTDVEHTGNADDEHLIKLATEPSQRQYKNVYGIKEPIPADSAMPETAKRSQGLNTEANRVLARLEQAANEVARSPEKAHFQAVIKAVEDVRLASDAAAYWSGSGKPEEALAKGSLTKAQVKLNNLTLPSASGGAPTSLDTERAQQLRDLASEYLSKVESEGIGKGVKVQPRTEQPQGTVHGVGRIASGYVDELAKRGTKAPVLIEHAGEGQAPGIVRYEPAYSAEGYLNKIAPSKTEADINSLAKVRERLGLTNKPPSREAVQSAKSLMESRQQTSPTLLERANTQAKFTTTPGELIDRHSVSLTDEKGKVVGHVDAQEEKGSNTWVVRNTRYSGTEGSRIGVDKGYNSLMSAAQKAADQRGVPVTVKGDAVQSEAAKGSWNRLGTKLGYEVKYSDSGRPRITFRPAKSSALPKPMGGAEPKAPEEGLLPWIKR